MSIRSNVDAWSARGREGRARRAVWARVNGRYSAFPQLAIDSLCWPTNHPSLALVSFFEPPPPPPERQEPRPQPPWLAPPENEFGVSVPIRLVLARTDELALALVDVVAYSTGFALRLALRAPPGAPELDHRGMMHPARSASPDEQFRFGVGFADGRKATNLAPRRPPGDASRKSASSNKEAAAASAVGATATGSTRCHRQGRSRSRSPGLVERSPSRPTTSMPPRSLKPPRRPSNSGRKPGQ